MASVVASGTGFRVQVQGPSSSRKNRCAFWVAFGVGEAFGSAMGTEAGSLLTSGPVAALLAAMRTGVDLGTGRVLGVVSGSGGAFVAILGTYAACVTFLGTEVVCIAASGMGGSLIATSGMCGPGSILWTRSGLLQQLVRNDYRRQLTKSGYRRDWQGAATDGE